MIRITSVALHLPIGARAIVRPRVIFVYPWQGPAAQPGAWSGPVSAALPRIRPRAIVAPSPVPQSTAQEPPIPRVMEVIDATQS